MRPHGHAQVSKTNPRAHGICDKCGFRFNLDTFQWQYEWGGPRLINLRILVCPNGCYDKPQEGLRTIILPPDPIPVNNPRPENYVNAANGGNYPPSLTSVLNPIGNLSGGVGTIGFDPVELISPQIGASDGWVVGNLIQYGGLRRAFDGNPTKPFASCAALSNSVANNTVGRCWTNMAGFTTGSPATQFTPLTLPAGQSLLLQKFVISAITVFAPRDRPFLGSGPASWLFQGSNDLISWVTLANGTTQGTVGEILSIPSVNLIGMPYFSAHRFNIVGDGTPVGVSMLNMFALGGSLAGANDLSQG